MATCSNTQQWGARCSRAPDRPNVHANIWGSNDGVFTPTSPVLKNKLKALLCIKYCLYQDYSAEGLETVWTSGLSCRRKCDVLLFIIALSHPVRFELNLYHMIIQFLFYFLLAVPEKVQFNWFIISAVQWWVVSVLCCYWRGRTGADVEGGPYHWLEISCVRCEASCAVTGQIRMFELPDGLHTWAWILCVTVACKCDPLLQLFQPGSSGNT